MPTVEQMGGKAHEGRVFFLELYAELCGLTAARHGYESILPEAAKRALGLQTTLAALEMRGRTDLYVLGHMLSPFYLDVKLTAFRADTGNWAVELYPAWRAWKRQAQDGVSTYFDLCGHVVRGDHLRALIRRAQIQRDRWRDGTAEYALFLAMLRGGRVGECDLPGLCPDQRAVPLSRKPTAKGKSSGDPFVVGPLGPIKRLCVTTEAFLAGEPCQGLAP